MRAFEFKLYENATIPANEILAKAKKSPEALDKAIKGVGAINDAARKYIELTKEKQGSPKPAVDKPAPKNFKPITPPSQQNQPASVESLDEAAENSIEELRQELNDNADLTKYLKFQASKGDKTAQKLVKELEQKAQELNKLLDVAIKYARNEYKVLDPDLEVMLEKTGSNNPQDLAKARSIFLDDDIDIKDAQEFVKQAGGEGIIDMNKLVEKRKGTLKDKDILLGSAKVAKVLDIVLPTFLEWKPGKTAGNVGPGEFALVMLGNPVSKEGKGDIKVGDDMYEVKAGGAKQKELKSGALGKPERTGAFFDSGSGKEARPHVEKMLKDYGFTNFKRDGGSRGPQFAYDLLNTKTNNWNTEFDRLNMDVDKRAEVLAKMASIIYSPGIRATEEFPFEKVKEDIKKILEKTDGSISLGQKKPDKDGETFSNNSELIRYFGKLALTKYREEGKSKDNFLFFNKTTFKFTVFKGEEMENEVMKPDSDLKAIAGVALSYTDSQSRSSPRFHLK